MHYRTYCRSVFRLKGSGKRLEFFPMHARMIKMDMQKTSSGRLLISYVLHFISIHSLGRHIRFLSTKINRGIRPQHMKLSTAGRSNCAPKLAKDAKNFSRGGRFCLFARSPHSWNSVKHCCMNSVCTAWNDAFLRRHFIILSGFRQKPFYESARNEGTKAEAIKRESEFKLSKHWRCSFV